MSLTNNSICNGSQLKLQLLFSIFYSNRKVPWVVPNLQHFIICSQLIKLVHTPLSPHAWITYRISNTTSLFRKQEGSCLLCLNNPNWTYAHENSSQQWKTWI